MVYEIPSLWYTVLEIVSALFVDVIKHFSKTHVCSVVQEYFVLLWYLYTPAVLK